MIITSFMKSKLIILTAILISLPVLVKSQISVKRALCENKENPVGVNTEGLFFSWEMQSGQESVTQSAYKLLISSSEAKLKKGIYDVHNTGIVKSARSIQVPYTGKKLKPAETYYWKVRVWDNRQKPSQWSDMQQFTTGIFKAEAWKNARWIAYEDMPDSMRVVPFIHWNQPNQIKDDDPKKVRNATSPLLRKKFRVSKQISSALLFISGLGHYEASINGRKIGNSFLSAGWTNYDKTALYNTYDVTSNLQEGDNAIGVILGNGFYNISQERYVKGTGAFGKPRLIALLKVTYTDGTNDYIVSDKSWKTTPSPVTFNTLYGGEDYDARLEQAGWNTNAFDDNAWKDVVIVAPRKELLLPEIDYPVMLMDSLAVKKKTSFTNNITVYDFGQNISGIPKITVSGKEGQTIKIFPAELLDKTGKINQEFKPHYYSYTLKGNGEEIWHPKFSYYAVRYLQVEITDSSNGQSRPLPVIKDIKLLHNRNSSPSNGSFACSKDLFNSIFLLIDWAVKSNLQSYITDNPQREKLSWQGEQNFMREAINYNYEIYNLYRSLVLNIKDAQHESGLVPDIAPEYIKFGGPFVDSPEWGTTGILDMWFLYKLYGDSAMIRKSYSMMTSYAKYLESKAENNLLNYGLGDWLDVGNVTPKGITATTYYYHAIDCLAQMSALIGEKNDAKYYANLADKIKAAFNRKFFNKEKKIYGTGSQTAMAMPIYFGIVEEQYKDDVLNNFVTNIKLVDSNKLTAGDVGNRYLIKALFENGHENTLYNITNRDDVPGYGYMLKKGATALVETWDGRASQNQLAMGHILEWFHGGIVGISQEESSVAFKNVMIRPQPVGDITWAKGTFHSPYGWIKSEWTKKSSAFTINVEIPVNTSATLYLPATQSSKIYKNGKKSSGYRFDNGMAIFETGSGKYEIKVEQ
jgi:alpha-L-rhamnosidase